MMVSPFWNNYFPYVKIPDKMDQHGCINYSRSIIDKEEKNKSVVTRTLDTENRINITKMRNYNKILHSIDGWKIFKWEPKNKDKK